MTARRFALWWGIPLVVALLAAMARPGPTSVARQGDATPAADATPVAAGPAPLATAAVVPDDALVYLAAGLAPGSAQRQRADELLRRAGLDDLIAQAMQADSSGAISTEDEELALLLDGKIALVVTDAAFATTVAGLEVSPPTSSTASDAEPPAGMAIVIAARDPDAAEALVRELIEEDADLRGSRVLEVEEGDATIAYAPGDEFEAGSAFVRLGDVLVVSATPDDLAPFVAVDAGTAPALAGLPAFNRVREELPADFLAYGFTNGPAFKEAAEAFFAAATAAGVAPAEAALAAPSLDGLDVYAGTVLWADDPGFRVDAIVLPAEGATLPPVPANFDPALDERVPADTIFFVDGYDLGATLGPSLDMLATSIVQAAAEDPDFPLPLPAGITEAEATTAIYELAGRLLAFNPRSDLFEQMSGEWGLAVSAPSEEWTGISAVAVSGVADANRLDDALSKLAVWANLLVIGLLSDSPEAEEALFGEDPVGARTEGVDGALTQVIEVPIPDLGTTITVQWGIVDGRFVLGVGDGFTDFVAGGGQMLADNPRYQAVMAELPSEHYGVFYLDLARIVELAMPVIEASLAEEAELSGTPAPELPDLSAVQAIGAVAFERDGLQGSSAILYVAP